MRASTDTCKIGFITGLTGPYANLAKNQIKGAELAAAEINATGGVGGQQAEVVVRDDQMDVQRAEVLSRELLEQEHCCALAGSFSAATQLSMNAVARAAEVPFVSCSQSNDINTAEHLGPLTFHEALTPYMTGVFHAQWGVQEFGKRWFSLIPDYEWGWSSYESTVQALKPLGGTDLGFIKVPLGASVEEYEATFDEILAKKPDVLSVRSFGNDQVNFTKAAARRGLRKEVPILLGIAETTVIHQATLDELVGMYWGANFYWGLEDRIPSAKEFVSSFRDRYQGELPTGYSAYAYTAVKELLIALRETKWETGKPYDDVRTFMEGRHFDHCKGPQWWRPCDHQSFQDFFILRFKGPEESRSKYDVAELIDTVSWDLSIERSCETLGFR